ncbi:putative rna recognition domain-containing protein [Erysiphe neolycopersici]|uniref:Putative rna recognition domain-containing protein n=1 Tax=Erysiphe neolycopersici TaxID=212602 RepID=A0A420HVY7_9PEZI|nr:putative rna recognition domain-containing protein [Erysiphe neolycopersici]
MSPQDSFIDDDEDSCPLCVEEFDLSDKNFWPCPCGYQICQFCYNNIKNNINGLCPACRRPYDEKNIEWKVVTPEEIAQFKANVQKNAKKKQEQRQKEAQKREVESMNRKHLSGLRVVQKNLVYVVGISSAIPEQEILSTLRGEKYFGQYGKIVKIVVSNKKQGDPSTGGQSLGVYVTFARKEDAARCIAAVNGSQNGDRVLRAQLGTTKYCSAYLRNETCTNKNCMFLHEPGDNDDSYSRQDLSSINSVNQERQFSSLISGATSSRQSTHPQSLYTSNPQTQTMTRECSKDESENGDSSALPSSASWANRGLPQRNRRDSHSTNGAMSSPAISQSLPATVEVAEESPKENHHSKSETSIQTPSDSLNNTEVRLARQDTLLISLLAAINSPLVSFPPPKPAGEVENYNKFPPLFDEWGGRKRKAMREQSEDSRKNLAKNYQEELQTMPELLEEEELESGSLQLGGEPEDQDVSQEGALPTSYHNQRQSNSQNPIQRFANNGPFGPRLGQAFPKNLGNLNSVNGRALTPLQQQQFLLMKTGQQSEYMDQYPPGIGSQYAQNSTSFQHHGHGRQASRYNFNNDASTSSTASKTPTNAKIMSQTSSMVSSGNISQQAGYYPSIQGPPPGLKSTSTPPNNGSMFTQNFGFGSSVSGALLGGMQKENNGDMLRDMIRGRGVASGSQTHDSGKREYMFPSFLHQYPSTSSSSAPAPGMTSIYGPQTGAFHDFGQKQKKKGKKHRHVNTSSSGEGGLIDLADPSILQARMQHQQQTNPVVGQGLFGGQAQGGYNSNMMYGAGFARW